MTEAGPDAPPPREGERIAKWLARAGVASRRDAERLLTEGRVSLNNARVEHPATFVSPGDIVQGQRHGDRQSGAHPPVALPQAGRPDDDAQGPKGRPTVFEKLPADLPRVVSVGRLDLTSEGLLLLTNDGALAPPSRTPVHRVGCGATACACTATSAKPR